MKVAIIGAGLAGLAAGYQLSKEGVDIVIYESKNIGGLVASYLIDGYHIERYYHHIFKSDKTILALIDELALNSRLEWLKGTTGYHINGKLYPLNTPKEIYHYPYLSFGDKIRLALLVLQSKKKNVESLDNITAKEFILDATNEPVYSNFFEPLLRSKFGDEKNKVSASWLLSRVKIRSDRSMSGERLGYMRGGFHTLIEAVLKEIERKGGEIEREAVRRIIIKDDKVIGLEVGRGYINCDTVISTISPRTLNDIVGIKLVKGIKYQGIVCALFALKHRLMDDTYWLNLKADVPFGAVIEHTNFAPFQDYKEHLLYVTSYFQDLNNPLWMMSEEEVIHLYLEGLKKLFPSFEDRTINWWKLSRDIDAAPIFETGFKSKVLPYKTKIKGLYLAGMFSSPNYPERSMNGSIEAGLECAKIALSNFKTAHKKK